MKEKGDKSEFFLVFKLISQGGGVIIPIYPPLRGLPMLFSVFLALTLFGGVVTLLDFIGGLGDHGSGEDHSGGTEGDSAVGVLTHNNAPAVGDASHMDGTQKLPDRSPGSQLYRVISFLRRSVYFSLGAGGAGLAALLTGAGELGAVLWSAGVGAGSLGLLTLVRRFQHEDLDSTVSEDELLYEEGEVTVSILPGQIGRIRLTGKGSLIERYARSHGPAALNPGDSVKVVEVQQNLLVVEACEQGVHRARIE